MRAGSVIWHRPGPTSSVINAARTATITLPDATPDRIGEPGHHAPGSATGTIAMGTPARHLVVRGRSDDRRADCLEGPSLPGRRTWDAVTQTAIPMRRFHRVTFRSMRPPRGQERLSPSPDDASLPSGNPSEVRRRSSPSTARSRPRARRPKASDSKTASAGTGLPPVPMKFALHTP